jgi:hypothetical protein
MVDKNLSSLSQIGCNNVVYPPVQYLFLPASLLKQIDISNKSIGSGAATTYKKRAIRKAKRVGIQKK